MAHNKNTRTRLVVKIDDREIMEFKGDITHNLAVIKKKFNISDKELEAAL